MISIVPRPRASRAFVVPSRLLRKTSKNFTATSQQLHSNFTQLHANFAATSRELHTNFTNFTSLHNH